MFAKFKYAWPEKRGNRDRAAHIVASHVTAVDECTLPVPDDANVGPRCIVRTVGDSDSDSIVQGSIEEVTGKIRGAFLAQQVSLEEVRKAIREGWLVGPTQNIGKEHHS